MLSPKPLSIHVEAERCRKCNNVRFRQRDDQFSKWMMPHALAKSIVTQAEPVNCGSCRKVRRAIKATKEIIGVYLYQPSA